MLTSLTNERVKLVRALQAQRKMREKEGRFVIEGARLVEEALRANAKFDFVFYTADPDDRTRGALGRLREIGATAIEVSPQVMKACADTESPQGVLGVVFAPTPGPSPVAEQHRDRRGESAPTPPHPHTPLILICDHLSDPGNLGTLLRAAAAAGANAALLAPGCVDAFNPKVVRGGMGAHFRLQIESLDWNQISDRTRDSRVRLADMESPIRNLPREAATRYDLANWTLPSALIIGSEADGPSDSARALAAETVFIPMPGGTESLNAAMAGVIILFEAVRQRGAMREA